MHILADAGLTGHMLWIEVTFRKGDPQDDELLRRTFHLNLVPESWRETERAFIVRLKYVVPKEHKKP